MLGVMAVIIYCPFCEVSTVERLPKLILKRSLLSFPTVVQVILSVEKLRKIQLF